MNNRSFMKHARALVQGGALAIVTISFAIACGNDTPFPDEGGAAGKGGRSSVGTAGQPGSSGEGAMEDAGSAGMMGEAGEAGAAAVGGMNAGGAGGTGGRGGSGGTVGGAGGAQGGSGGSQPVCGNNKVEAGEQCDDGNTKSWDGCSSTCKNRCEQCEKQQCVPLAVSDTFFQQCFSEDGPWANKFAVQGPSAGQSLQKLCVKAVECMRRTNCAQSYEYSEVKGCFCGDVTTQDCNNPQKGGKGPCVNEIAAAAESMALADVSQRWKKTDYAIGIAARIAIGCDNTLCPAECLADKQITACERCTIGTPTDALWPSAYFPCYFQSPAECTSSTGPTQTCAATTCAPAADCALATRCAENGVANCYGTTGQGPCAAQFAAAAGSTDPATVLDRLQNGGDYASSVLVSLLETERADTCKSTCFPSGSAGTGTGGQGGASGGSGGTGG